LFELMACAFETLSDSSRAVLRCGVVQSIEDAASKLFERHPPLENRNLGAPPSSKNRDQRLMAIGFQTELPGFRRSIERQNDAGTMPGVKVGDGSRDVCKEHQRLVFTDSRGNVDPVDDDIKEAVKWRRPRRCYAFDGWTGDYVNG
jgi:hypothetical protein